MNRLLAATVLALCALVRPSGLAQTRAPSEFPSDVDAVTVDVVVLDERQQPVEGLRREDFTVLEDGRPQAIGSFDAVAVPESTPTRTATRSRVSTNARVSPVERSFVIVFDDANLTPTATPHARASIATFLREGLRAGDQVMVVPTSGGAWWSGRMPEDRDSLLAHIEQLQGKFRPSTGPDHIWDHEALAISMERDPKMIAYVARRFFENNIIPSEH
jgi:VWFA-related protein